MGNQAKRKKGKNGRGKLPLIICAVVITLLLVVIMVLLFQKKDDENEKRNVVVTPDNVEEIIAQMDDEEFVDPGYYSASMNTEWHFSKGDAVSEDAVVNNLAENTNDVYFDVFLETDEATPIYKSPVIPIGSSLTDIALDMPLEAGTHDCVMVYHLVDEEQNTISTLRVALKIVVES